MSDSEGSSIESENSSYSESETPFEEDRERHFQLLSPRARTSLVRQAARAGRRDRRQRERQARRSREHTIVFSSQSQEEKEEQLEELEEQFEEPPEIEESPEIEETEEMSAQGTAPQPSTGTKKVTVNGVEIVVLAVPKSDQDIKAGPIIKKEDRVKLDQDKLLKITTQMEEGLEKKYTEVSVEEEDLSVLENTYELTQQNKKIFAKLKDWDMADVFTLVLGIDANTGTATTKDLIKDWPTIPRKEVQQSNTWYRTTVDPATSPWIVQNLRSSHRFIINSCDPEMQDQITDILLGYKESEKGGPLTFKILMDLVQSNSERAIKHLISSVKSMDIKNFDGEDVTAAVAQMRGAHNRLKMVNIGTSNQNAVPVTFNEDVMDVLQTTSTEDFNVAFDYQRQRAMFKLTLTSTVTPTIEDIFQTAIDLYTDMLASGKWEGKAHVAKESVFTTKINVDQGAHVKSKRKCFNCGSEDHMSNNCPKPKDEEKIKTNRAKFLENKAARGGGRGGGRGGRGGGGRGGRGNNTRKPLKWSPPTSSETDGTRMIEVKGQLHKHKYNTTTKRWDRVSKPTANPSVTTTTTTTTPNTTPDDATRRAALANMQQQLMQMNNTFTAFLQEKK